MKKASVLILTGLLLGLLFAGRLAAQSTSSPSSFILHPSSFSTLPPSHFWLTERLLKSPAHFRDMTDRWLAIDANGRPHMVYGQNQLFYAWYDGASWQREMISTPSFFRVYYPSLALDAAGRPHVAYVGEQQLWYAYRSNNQWHRISLGDSLPFSTAVAIDSLGYPHIAYNANNQLLYVHQNAAGWYWYEIKSDVYIYNISLALDAADHAHISYLEDDDTVHYAHWTGSQWQLETADPWQTPGIHQVASSIALDSQGRPTIAYQAGTGIKLATRADNGWNIVPFNNDAYGSWVSLAIDANNVPHLAYYDSHQDGQMYATRPADSWLITPIDTQPDAGNYTAIALDPQGRPHISYARYPHDIPFPALGDLRYAHLDGTTWQVATLDTSADYSAPSLALDSEDRPHFLYHEYLTWHWYYLRPTAGGWISEAITSPNGGNDFSVSFQLDSDNQPHFIYTDSASNLHYAYRAGDNQWIEQPLFSNVSRFAKPLSLALDTNDQPHIAFVSSAADAVQYAYLDAGNNNWVIETINPISVSLTADYIFLQLDSLDQPHVVYSNLYLDYVHYAHRPAGLWLDEAIIGVENLDSPLVLDSQGRPHFLADNGPNGIEHLYRTGNQWSSQHLDTPCIARMTLAIDGEDRLHFAARGRLDEYPFLCYGYQQGENWIIHEVDHGYLYTNYASLALTDQGLPLIVYMDNQSNVNLGQLATDLTYSPLILKP